MSPVRRVLFLIRSLGAGGAERQLVALAGQLADVGISVTVAVFYPGGVLEPTLAGYGIRVIPLGKQGRWDLRRPIAALDRLLRLERPDVVHSYLPDANLLAALLRIARPEMRLVWGVRASAMRWSSYDRAAYLSFTATRILSRVPDLIIANSHAGQRHHVAQGYPTDRIHVIPNGFDTRAFAPDPESRARTRSAWGIGQATPLIGMVARLDPMKRHGTFLESAVRVHAAHADARFVIVGSGPRGYTDSLRAMAGELGVAHVLRWEGERSDMPAVYNALDLAVLTSEAEGFPNVLGEAMACGVPCVTTDAGDAAWLVGDTGLTTAASDAEGVADAISRILREPPEARRMRGRAARTRIEQQFSLTALREATIAALEHAVGRGGPPRRAR